MNILDFFIVIGLVAQGVAWAHDGFARRFFSLAGFWAGVIIGALLTPSVLGAVGDPLLKLVLTLFLIFSMAALFGSLGLYAGHRLKTGLKRIQLGRVDSVLGAVFGIGTGLLVVWIFSAIISGTPFRGPNQLIRDSWAVQRLNDMLPDPPEAFSRIAGLINPERFPQIFIGPEPRPIAPVEPPSSAELAAALEAAGESTVRFESAGCGGIVYGSGFVAAPSIVVTNAHVVAGIEQPVIVDEDGSREAEVIYFDPDLDMAVLRADDLAGPPLDIDESPYPRGTAAIALGYPGGGPLKPVEAGVLRELDARGFNIYNNRVVERDVYMLQTSIIPGNSGGPVVLPDGTVIGMIFGRSEADEDVGYAVTGAEIRTRLNQAMDSMRPVSTGVCVR